jgi:hypothetical protein
MWLVHTEECGTNVCPVDCAYGTWGDWGQCSQPCGGRGTEVRHRSVVNSATSAAAGKPCRNANRYRNVREERKCGTETCGPPVRCNGVKCDYVVHPVHGKYTLRVAHPKSLASLHGGAWSPTASDWEKKLVDQGYQQKDHINHVCRINKHATSSASGTHRRCECKCFTEDWAKKYMSHVLWPADVTEADRSAKIDEIWDVNRARLQGWSTRDTPDGGWEVVHARNNMEGEEGKYFR